MHFVIFGAGAIGGFYGTKLAKYIKENNSDYRLSFIARGKTFDVLKNNGSKLICKKETLGEMQETIIMEKNLNVYERYQDLEIKPDEYTTVLLCVKSKDTLSCCEDIKENFSDYTLVISVQNGIENEERIISTLGEKHCLPALTTVAAEVLEPGIYLQKGNYGLVMGELEQNRPIQWNSKQRLEAINDIFNAADIKSIVVDDIYQKLWSKLVWNASFNPTSVLYEKTIGPLMADKRILELIQGVMCEVKALAEAEGYKLADDVVEKHIERTNTPAWYDFRTSMLQDFQNDKPIELDDLLGVVIRKAKKHNLVVPNAKKLLGEMEEKLMLLQGV